VNVQRPLEQRLGIGVTLLRAVELAQVVQREGQLHLGFSDDAAGWEGGAAKIQSIYNGKLTPITMQDLDQTKEKPAAQEQ
jgi:hypothetical protein